MKNSHEVEFPIQCINCKNTIFIFPKGMKFILQATIECKKCRKPYRIIPEYEAKQIDKLRLGPLRVLPRKISTNEVI